MVLPKTDLSAVLPTGYGKSLIYQLICFLADGLNIFPQAFIATDLPYVTFRFTNIVTIAFFLDRLLLAFPNVRRSSNLKIYFLTQNNKNRKYDNALAPTDLSRKKWRDSDWIILTARHSTIEWILHS